MIKLKDFLKIANDKVSTQVNEYQKLTAITISKDLTWEAQGKHALHGMVGKIGELHSLYQKKYQGHPFDEEHTKKEVGDQLRFIAEYSIAYGWDLNDIVQMNIDKLRARYPEGFDEDRSLHRKLSDI